MSSLRCRPCPPSAAAPLDNDDLLSEILLRLPPQPSSLPRASAVCKRWRLLVSDPRFVRRFCTHHRRNPPLLGYFVEKPRSLFFVPTMEAPNRVPPGRLSLPIDRGLYCRFLGCRDGLALISGNPRHQFLVWDPVTGDQHQLPVPPGFDPTTATGVSGTVLGAAAGGVHFQVVFAAANKTRALACVYSSETGSWGDLVSTPIRSDIEHRLSFFHIFFPAGTVSPEHAVLVGGSLYWRLTGCSSSILEFDLEKRSLAVIPVPVDVFYGDRIFMVIRADGGGLGFLFLPKFTLQLWKRKTDCDGVASWVLETTIGLDKLLPLDSESQDNNITIQGFAEENNVVFLRAPTGLYEVQLKSLQLKRLPEFDPAYDYYPFESIYTTG